MRVRMVAVMTLVAVLAAASPALAMGGGGGGRESRGVGRGQPRGGIVDGKWVEYGGPRRTEAAEPAGLVTLGLGLLAAGWLARRRGSNQAR